METPRYRGLTRPEQERLAEQEMLAYFRAVEQGEERSIQEWRREGAQLTLELDAEPPVPAAPLVPADPEADERFTGLSALLMDSQPWLFNDLPKRSVWEQAPCKHQAGRAETAPPPPPATEPEPEEQASNSSFSSCPPPVLPEEPSEDDARFTSLTSLSSCLPPAPCGPNEPPPLAVQAFHGIVGEVVRAIEPETEADPVAVLLTFLAGIGNLIGPGPHARVESSRHALRLFLALVGESSKARKGTSEDRVRDLLHRVDPFWEQYRIQTGISSGEGIIAQIRDPEPAEGADPPSVPAVDDKRMLLIEPELGSLLKVMGREGNTVSPVLRCAWDGKTLQTMTKNYPQRATGAHVSLIGHTTRPELRRYLNQTEAANGFGNRFLWACVRRSKILPFGGSVVQMGRLAEELKVIVAQARQIEEIQWGQQAAALWREVYEGLSAGAPGLFGAVTGRAEAQVLRLAALYAVLDERAFIQPAHLLAALAVWGYCEASAALIFGDPLGDPLTDLIEEKLKPHPAGLTRTELHTALGGNYSRDRFNAALALLEQTGRARARWEDHPRGRPTQRWCWLPEGRSMSGRRHLIKALEVLQSGSLSGVTDGAPLP